MSFPLLKKGTGQVVAVFEFATYGATLVRDPESAGPIKYRFILVITAPPTGAPILAVTCERNEMQAAMIQAVSEDLDADMRAALSEGSGYFLCYFDRNGDHHNVREYSKVPSVDEFRVDAFSIAQRILKVDAAPRITEQRQSGSLPTPREAMRTKWISVAIASILAVVLTAGLLWHLQQPKNYEDCILQNMKGVTSETAAKQIAYACRARY